MIFEYAKRKNSKVLKYLWFTKPRNRHFPDSCQNLCCLRKIVGLNEEKDHLLLQETTQSLKPTTIAFSLRVCIVDKY